MFCLPMRPTCGFLLTDGHLWSLLVPVTLVGLFFCSGLVTKFQILDSILMAIFFWLSFLFAVWFFALLLYMLSTAITNVMISLFHVFPLLIPPSPLLCAVTSMQHLIEPLTGVGVVRLGSGKESRDTLLSFFQDCCIIDIWCSLHPGTSGFTWDKPDGLISSRIDLIGCPYAWAPFANSCSIIPCPFSDHSIVCLNITVPEVCPCGPGKRKLNISVLKDDAFISDVKKVWSK